jgi:hypothetical protein
MRKLSIVGLSLAVCSSCRLQKQETASKVLDAPVVAYPSEVSCLLSMQKVANPTGAVVVEKLAHSCNEFTVSNDSEMKIVTRSCLLSHRFEGWTYKINFSACDRIRAYAVCRVQDTLKPSETVDTYYYLGTEPPSKPVTERERVQAGCKEMGGALEITAK